MFDEKDLLTNNRCWSLEIFENILLIQVMATLPLPLHCLVPLRRIMFGQAVFSFHASKQKELDSADIN